MSTTTEQRAIDLMPQLRDILHLPEDLGLPLLWAIFFEARASEPGWSVSAQLHGAGKSDPERWDALKAWAPGVTPELDSAHSGGEWPSGSWRQASVTVVVAEVSVKIWTHVDGLFESPEQVHVTGEAAALLIGGASA